MQEESGTVKEQPIKDSVEYLLGELRILDQNLNNMVQRNPQPIGEDGANRPQQDNIFDEILSTLSICRAITREATTKIQELIINKVI